MSAARRAWGAVGGYVFLLLAVQPRLGFAVDAFKARWGERTLDRTAYLVAAAAALALALAGARWWRLTTAGERAAAAAALLAYAWGVAALEVPQERLHYLEYGLLAALVYRAVEPMPPAGARPRAAPLVAAALVTGGIGLLDEILQGWLWARRYFDWADVWLNLRAGALGLLVAVPARAARRRAGAATSGTVRDAARPPGPPRGTDSASRPRG